MLKRVYIGGHRDTCKITHLILKLERDINSITGKQIAKQRTEYMKVYLNEFFKEWNFDGK